MKKDACALFSVAFLFAATLTAQQTATMNSQIILSPKVVKTPVAEVRAYWMQERLESAKPMPIPEVEATSMNQAAVSSTGTIHFSPAHAPLATLQDEASESNDRFPLNTGDDFEGEQAESVHADTGFSYEMPFNNYRAGSNTSLPYTAVGKLFFTVPSGASVSAGKYVCSASIINDGRGTYGLTLVTSRQCVWDYVKKVWYKNWVFYPGWNNGADSQLGSAWYPEIVGFTYDSTLKGGFDLAMMEMHDRSGSGCNGSGGHPIGYYTGWLGWAYGGSYTQRQWNILGYPQASPFEGNYLYNDEAATGTVNPYGSTNVVEVGNPQTGGAAGGPWILGFDLNNNKVPSPGNNIAPGYLNMLNGVNSFKWSSPSHPESMNGTIFTQSNFYVLLTVMKSSTCN
jgi:hypothetical protein